MTNQTFLRQKTKTGRGERMKKMLMLLLVVGFLAGAFSIVEALSESYEHVDLLDIEMLEEDYDDPVPCGGGEGGGSGGGLPG